MPETETIIDLKQGPDGTYVPSGESEKPKRTHKKRTRKQEQPASPTGRLDVLCSGVVEAAVKQSQNPFVRMAYDAFKPTVDQVFREKLGPQPRKTR
jgi:hypothetical protein